MKKKLNLPSLTDIILAFFGAMLCGLGCGFINYASFGMDGVGIFYDGIRNTLHLSADQIGTASYIVTGILSLFLWFADRRYVSFGSIIYILTYGIFANWGTMLFEHLLPAPPSMIRIIIALLGLLTLYLGLGIYIAIDIGVDAFTGVMLYICNKTRKELKNIKILFDLSLVILGRILGGKLGVITLISILIGGPCISFLTQKIQKTYFQFKLRNKSH
ncbi:MAG: hypothetical protein K6E98_06755 [Lachnospiraceae bacterium]|nr:hypothetical protein [Lachnospiraceae bacterium]